MPEIIYTQLLGNWSLYGDEPQHSSVKYDLQEELN